MESQNDNFSRTLSELKRQFASSNLDEIKMSGGNKYNKLIIGFHTSKDGNPGILKPLTIDAELLKKYNFRPAAQIFTQVPQTSVFCKLEPQDEIIKLVKKQDMSLIIHSPYTINDFWKKNDLTKLHRSLDNAELFVNAEDAVIKSNDERHFKGIVIHLPKMESEDVTNVIKNRKNVKVPILLENHAYKPGTDSYELPSKLNELTDLLVIEDTPNWGYCIDTAHLFVCISESDRNAGYCIEKRYDMERWLSQLTEETRSRIKAWHLNGSVNPASSYDDKHSIPVFGVNHLTNNHIPDQMWGNLLLKNEIIKEGIDKHIDTQIKILQNSSLVPILKHAMTYNIPVILEINRGNNDDIESCMKMFSYLETEIHKAFESGEEF